jgi:hypothetical protein
LAQRKEKLNKLLASQDATEKKRLFQEIFYGVPSGKAAEPGMAGSLLYHMAMVSKMEAEAQVLLNELNVAEPDISQKLERFYEDFLSDAAELTQTTPLTFDAKVVISGANPTSAQKIALFTNLNQKTRALVGRLKGCDREVEAELDALFQVWTNLVAEMRFRQEYQTIKGVLTLSDLAKTFGVNKLDLTMQKIQDEFGRQTVSIALDMRREKLQSVMLSDHYINYNMSVDTLDGRMQFLNCPIHGEHKYIGEKLGIPEEVISLFCTHFCFAHAKAMLETVLPFTFHLTQPERMATDGKCEYYMRLGHSTEAQTSEKFIPLVISWNLTRKCNLKCSHCYINATQTETEHKD